MLPWNLGKHSGRHWGVADAPPPPHPCPPLATTPITTTGVDHTIVQLKTAGLYIYMGHHNFDAKWNYLSCTERSMQRLYCVQQAMTSNMKNNYTHTTHIQLQKIIIGLKKINHCLPQIHTWVTQHFVHRIFNVCKNHTMFTLRRTRI